MKIINLYKYPLHIKDLIKRRFLPHGEGVDGEASGVSSHKYKILYDEIRKYKPKNVLECGAGKTTILIAQALRDNGGGLVTSMEENKFYYNDIKKRIPEELKSYIDLRLSSKIEDTYMMFRGVRYKDVPKREYDYVFIDGPTTGWNKEKTFDFDIIEVVRNQTEPVNGLIDCRTSTVFVLSLIFGNKVTFDYASGLGYINEVTDLRNTDNIVRRLPMHFIKRH